MKIGIDARMLGTGFGLARYIQQLVLHLEMIDTENHYFLFMRQDNWHEFVPKNTNFHKVLADFPWYGWAEQAKFPKLIKQTQVDLMHFPHWNVPLFYRDPYIVTIHDLTMFRYKRAEASTHGPILYWFKDFAHRLVIKNAVKTAKLIITTSNFTRNDINSTLRVPMDKMHVTYQAPFSPLAPASDRNAVVARYGISKPYALYVGASYPHKNLAGLVDYWTELVQKYGDNFQLVLVGKDSFFYQKLIREKIETLDMRIQSTIVYAGFAPDKDLATLYSCASLYVFPSLYEGFGLPPLEAMSYGIPVASSDRSCLPEILRDAALYFDPENIDDAVETIWQGLTSEEVRNYLLKRARHLLPFYSWEKLAEQTKNLYQKCG